VGYLTEAANTVGAQWVGSVPHTGGKNAAQMLSGSVKAAILLQVEPEFDSALGADATMALSAAEMVISLSPFKANMDICDVMLPIAPFTETSGTFVNAEGRVQSFHAVVKPAGDARPAWKVLRVLANLLKLPGFEFDSSQEVLATLAVELRDGATFVPAALLDNTAAVSVLDVSVASVAPVVASIYQLDGMVRRATSLQLTADARQALGTREGVLS
jgi:NADH-quinone oxidoreductase subunit G